MNKRRFAAALLSIAVMLSSAPANAYSADRDSAVSNRTEIIRVQDTYINPLYESEDVQLTPKHKSSGDTHISSTTVYKTIDSAAIYVRKQLKMRNPDFSVAYDFKADHELSYDELKKIDQDIMNKAMEHTGVPTEGDYLLWQYERFDAKISGTVENNEYSIIIKYALDYHSDSNDEKAVDAKLKSVMPSLNLNGLNDTDKVKKIYDYICKNVKYDHIGNNPKRYTAYGALIDNVCVCQGYALLFYRMALEEGIDARIISGHGQNQDHGWNIVRLNGVYYNLDTTWDAGNTDYKYFLKSDGTFPNHSRDEKYRTSEFYAKYPMTSAPMNMPQSGNISQPKIPPKSTYITSLTAKSKGFTVKWQKQTDNTDGYILQYSRNSAFAKVKSITVPENTVYSKKISGLSSGKKYSVRICTYKTYDGKKVLSSWSAKKSIKTKK